MNCYTVITGASSGIGEALAYEYASNKKSVILLARREERLKKVLNKCNEIFSDGNHHYLICDVTNQDHLNNFKNFIEDKKIDCIIANAGIGAVKRMDQVDRKVFEDIMNTNVYGVFDTVNICIPKLRETKGKIGIVGSIQSYITVPNNGTYCISKYAVRSLAEAYYYELFKEGISCTFIAPGYIASEIRRKRYDDLEVRSEKEPVPSYLVMPTDVASKKIVSGINKRKRHLLITPIAYVVYGIITYIPWLFHWYMSRQFPGKKEH